MRTIYDYSGLRISRLRQPRFRHILLLIITWGFYFTMYFLTENLIPPEACHATHCSLDDHIPFCEYFLIFYCGWYLLIIVSLGYYFFYDVPRLCQLDLYIFVTQVAAMAAYILYPSRQDLRPEVFASQNVFTLLLGFIYAFDTNTGVCPSLHVAYSIAILSVAWKDPHIPKWAKWGLLVLVICISLSTAFVKQHSLVDAAAAIPTALLGEILIYHTKWGRQLEKGI